jgi:lantibiotic modifying enzyme
MNYSKAAEQAFNYERYWFNADVGNWPNFFTEPHQARQRKPSQSFVAYWCHGAPGIALSRLRAYEILGDETCRSEGITALQTTHQVVETWLYSGSGNYSLCHGLAGNSEILSYGGQVLGQKWGDKAALVYQVAKSGIDIYAMSGTWPCGVNGETPSLMLGLAGIGYFYLRLYNPTVPSILILHRNP